MREESSLEGSWLVATVKNNALQKNISCIMAAMCNQFASILGLNVISSHFVFLLFFLIMHELFKLY